MASWKMHFVDDEISSIIASNAAANAAIVVHITSWTAHISEQKLCGSVGAAAQRSPKLFGVGVLGECMQSLINLWIIHTMSIRAHRTSHAVCAARFLGCSSACA